MHAQAKAGKPLWQYRHDFPSVRFHCASKDTLIGQAHQKTSALHAWLSLLLTPLIQDMMQEYIGSYG
jgi:hypothetical protein